MTIFIFFSQQNVYMQKSLQFLLKIPIFVKILKQSIFSILNIILMIRGTTHDQDSRFCDKTKKMIQKSQWPDKYDIKIDLAKVDLQLMKVWIEKKLVNLLGEEDDVISGTIISMIDESLEKEQKLLAKNFHVAISGFLLDKTLTFVSQLWDLLDEAQRSARGIPESLLEEKKKAEELHRKKIDQLNAKRYKINSNKFNNVVKRFTSNRQEPYQRERQQRSEREHKKKKNKDRSRSRSHEKKKKHRRSEQKKRYRSRSREARSNSKDKQKRNKQKEAQDKYRRQKGGQINEKQQRQSQKAQKNKKRQQSPNNRSDSSGVVSSSNS